MTTVHLCCSSLRRRWGVTPNTDPLLGPLQDNGGPTFTHALLAGSPAIDAGDPAFVGPPDYDQRGIGFPRVVNGRIDIGAFEVQTPLNSTPQVTCPAAATLDCQPSAGSSLQLLVRATDPDNDQFLTVDLKEGTTTLDTKTLATPVNNTLVTFNSVTFLPGVHSLSVEASDGVAEAQSCVTSVTVNTDTEAPHITCPGDVTVYTGAGLNACGASATWSRTIS